MKSLFEHIDSLTSFTSLNEVGVDLGVNASVDLPDELVNTAAMALLADDNAADYKYTYNVDEIRSELEKAYAITSGYEADSADDLEYQELLNNMLKGIDRVESTTPLAMISQYHSEDYPGFKGGSVKTFLKDGRVFIWTEGDEEELPLVNAVELTLSNEIKESEELKEDADISMDEGEPEIVTVNTDTLTYEVGPANLFIHHYEYYDMEVPEDLKDEIKSYGNDIIKVESYIGHYPECFEEHNYSISRVDKTEYKDLLTKAEVPGRGGKEFGEQLKQKILSNLNESEDDDLNYNELSDTQIIDDIINSYDVITGQDIRTIFNYENTGNDSDGYFKQEEVDKTSNKIIDWLSKQGLSRSRIDDLLYKLDDKLASVWPDYAPTDVNEAEGKPLDKEKYSTLMSAIEDIVYDIGDNNQQKKDLLNDIVNEFKRCAEASGYPLTENEELKESEIMNDTNVVDICNSFSSRTNKNYKIEGDEAIFEDGTIIKFVLNDDNQIEYYFINTQGDASKTALVTDFSLLDLVTESAELKESEDPSMNLMNQLKEVVKGTQGVENVSEVSYEPYALMSYSLRFEQDGVTYILGLTEDESEE